MDKVQWYFKQPVTSDEMNFADTSVESAIRNGFKEHGLAHGVVSGYTVAPGSGLAVEITAAAGTESIAYDKQGRRIKPLTSVITQSIAAATDGGSTAVSGGGNERWVSIFAKAGRKFQDAATDGNGASVRKTNFETLNSLGEGTHGVGAYDSTLAKEAGIDKFYIAVGAENGIGSGVRPSLLDDAVLIADIRLVSGQSTVATTDIYFDRRQEMLTVDRERYSRHEEVYGTGYRTGVLYESFVTGSTEGLFVTVTGGRGWVYSSINGLRPYDLNNRIQRVQLDAPGSARHDHIIVDPEGHLRVLKGSVSVGGTLHPPAAPAGSVVLAEVRPVSGTTNTSTWPIANRRTRLAPAPLSSMTGILDGCRLAWGPWPPGSAMALSQPLVAMCWIKSKKNRIVINGEVTEFDGGPNTSLGPGYQKVVSTYDQNANPFATAADVNGRPYFIYVCRNVISANAPDAAPILILESTTAPDEYTGHPLAPLQSSWNVTATTDALCIGMGWVRPGTTYRAPVTATDDGWFYSHFSLGSVLGPFGGGNVVLPSVPDSPLVDKVKLSLLCIPSFTYSYAHTFGEWDAQLSAGPGAFGHTTIYQLPHQTSATPGGPPVTNPFETVGEFTIPAIRGRLSLLSVNATASDQPGPQASIRASGVHLSLPKIGFGAG